MKYRKLGRTGIQVSEIGFGAWGIGGWGLRDDAESLRALNRAIDLGYTFFDTAMGYGDGHSERLIGQVVTGKRDKVVIASKISPKTMRWPVLPHEPIKDTFSKEWVISCTENSLKNLKTDYLDVQQLHAWTPEYVHESEWYEGLLKLKEQGKVRAFGVSANDWDPYGTVSLVESGLIDSIQVIYNIFEQRPEERLLPAALKHQVGIIVRVPFEEGLLTGALRPGYIFPEGDWRANWLTPERLAEADRRVQALTSFLNDNTPSLATLALKFCLSHPAVSTVIPGIRTVKHAEANALASDGIPLAAEVVSQLKAHKFIHGWSYPWAQKAPGNS
ncbi:MAG TPA: aldo/keto reductase [Anaerolineaceae bacterium]